MKQINSFGELKEGHIYDIYCKPFDVTNKAILISFDTTGLDRSIAYFQFFDRGYTPINKEQLKLMFRKNKCPIDVFALWDHDLKHNTLTHLN